ncbi:hypothetical protein [Streptomyces chrestomyceticus]|uniref:hypothetical protein n=1 Tax=Streptomyces chrestomyceticus TaxID=68185 RepID=UPI0004CA62AC
MSIPELGGWPVAGSHLLRTLARTTDSGKKIMLVVGLALACVIDAQAVTGALEQATRLTVAVIVLIVVQMIAAAVSRVTGRRALGGGSTVQQ